MLSQPLPIVDRQLGSLSLQDALVLLANPKVFYLLTDPVNRLIGFKLREAYRANWVALDRDQADVKRSPA